MIADMVERSIPTRQKLTEKISAKSAWLPTPCQGKKSLWFITLYRLLPLMLDHDRTKRLEVNVEHTWLWHGKKAETGGPAILSVFHDTRQHSTWYWGQVS